MPLQRLFRKVGPPVNRKSLKHYTAEDVRIAFAEHVKSVGGGAAWAKAYNRSPTLVSLVLSGHRPVPEWVCELLGYRRVTNLEVHYERILRKKPS